LVDALVLSVSDPSGSTQINLSMRASVVHGKDNEAELQKLRIGAVVKGTVHRVTDFGVFVSIDETSLIGLSRKPMAVPSDATDLKDVYSVGGRVRAKILGISGSKISLGLKNSCFKVSNNEDEDDERVEGADSMEGSDDEQVLVDENSDDDDLQKLINEAALQSNSEEEEEEGEDDEEDEEDEEEDEEETDGNDEGLPMKKQKVSVSTSPSPLPPIPRTSGNNKLSSTSSTSSTFN
jgi:rRNA biogenesis protein RRP5